MPLSPAPSPPAPLPTIIPPPLLSPISLEVSLPPQPPSPASPPELPHPNFPATSRLAPPPFPTPITTSPPEFAPSMSPAASLPHTASRPPHSKPPELSQPHHLPSPELKTQFLSAPPTMAPPFFPTYEDPPPPPPPLTASPPSSLMSSSDISTTIGNQTTLDMGQQSHEGIVFGCVTGGVLLIAVLAVLYLCSRNRKNPKKTDHVKPWLRLKGTSLHNSRAVLPQNWQQAEPSSEGPRIVRHITNYSLTSGIFTYDELEVATNGFSKVNLLGVGGFGYVHRGVLANGKEVAVKKLKTRSKQGELEFQAEVETFSQVHHKHIVTLLGYCITDSERLLVYEFVPNKTLEFHLHGKEQPTMEWPTRLKIAIGSAKGLAYLHEDCNPTIIHRDIKAANILLDFKFDAKVSDFGLAKFFSDKSNTSCITHVSTRVIGTFGYLAPEYASSGKVTEKSDVYSFGVMLLELITGCPPICRTQDPTMNEGLVGWARPLLAQAQEDGNYDSLADPNLQGNYNAGEMATMVACAAACVRRSALLRPRMSQIVRILERDVSPVELNEGRMPRHGTILGALESSSTYDAYQYKEDLKKYNMALASLEHGMSRYSGSISGYGIYQSESGSSCELSR